MPPAAVLVGRQSRRGNGKRIHGQGYNGISSALRPSVATTSIQRLLRIWEGVWTPYRGRMLVAGHRTQRAGALRRNARCNDTARAVRWSGIQVRGTVLIPSQELCVLTALFSQQNRWATLATVAGYTGQ